MLLNKDQKQYTPIDTYKLSGRFVYNPDILEKIGRMLMFFSTIYFQAFQYHFLFFVCHHQLSD